MIFPKNYELHPEYGVLHQIEHQPFVYTEEYIKAYKNLRMYELSELRWNYITKAIGRNPLSVLDFGYGNGDFLKYCAEKGIKELYGYDVSPVEPPEGVFRIERFEDKTFTDLVCMFDSLEHTEDIGKTIKSLPHHNFIVITVPWCRNYNGNTSSTKKFTNDWFEKWHNRKANGEHLFHFDEDSLVNFMKMMEYEYVHMSCEEDVIRIPRDENNTPNILVGVFKKLSKVTS